MISLLKITNISIFNGYRKAKGFLLGEIVSDKKQAQPAGMDSSPIKGYLSIVFQTESKEDTLIMGVVDNKHRKSEEGETRIFATNKEGEEVFDIHLKKDGTVVFFGGNSSSVRFEELETAFNELKDDFNNHILNWNAFASVYTPGSPTTLGLPPSASTSGSSSADMGDSESPNVLIP